MTVREREARCDLRGTRFTCNEEGHAAVDCPRGNNGVKTCFYPCKAPGCTNKLYLTTTGRTPTSLSSAAQASAVHGDADVSGGIITDSTLPSLLEPSPVPHESLPLVESASSYCMSRRSLFVRSETVVRISKAQMSSLQNFKKAAFARASYSDDRFSDFRFGVVSWDPLRGC